MLEDAGRAALGLHHLAGLEPALAQRDHLAGVHLAHQLGADDVEGAALGGDDEAVAEPPQAERPDPVRVAEGDDRVLGHHHGRVGALEPRHHLRDRVLDRLAVVGGEQRGDDLRVGGAAELDPAPLQLAPELDRVGQVAVVGEGDLAAVVAPDRLRVLPGAAAGGRVADVADRHVALERLQLLLVEDLGDQARVAHRRDVAALAGGDPGRLLAAVLQRVEAEVGEAGDVVAGCVYAEDATLVVRSIAVDSEPLVCSQKRVFLAGKERRRRAGGLPTRGG